MGVGKGWEKAFAREKIALLSSVLHAKPERLLRQFYALGQRFSGNKFPIRPQRKPKLSEYKNSS